MVNNLAALSTLRYDKDVIGHFLERLQEKLMFSTDLFEESWLYKVFPELDRIDRWEALDTILVTAIDAHSAAEIRAAIEAALPVH
jgi:hypothetical protein